MVEQQHNYAVSVQVEGASRRRVADQLKSAAGWVGDNKASAPPYPYREADLMGCSKSHGTATVLDRGALKALKDKGVDVSRSEVLRVEVRNGLVVTPAKGPKHDWKAGLRLLALYAFVGAMGAIAVLGGLKLTGGAL